MHDNSAICWMKVVFLRAAVTPGSFSTNSVSVSGAAMTTQASEKVCYTFDCSCAVFHLLWDKMTLKAGRNATMQSGLCHNSLPNTSASIHNPLCVPNEHKTQKGYPQSVTDPNTDCSRAAGVLRYNRESDSDMVNSITTLQEAQCQAESSVKCEFCEKEACPLLDLTCKQDPEAAPHFCCTKRQQLSHVLMELRHLLEADTTRRNVTSEEDKTVRVMEERLCQGRGVQRRNKFGAPAVKSLRFRLSCAPEKEFQKVFHSNPPTNDLKTKGDEPMWVSYCSHQPIHFGLCYQQPAGFLQKFYSSGKKFLTAFPDGSAQVFYPSGLLALVVVVTEHNGRVCIVYNDNNAPCQTVRSVFQSDGRAACYHSNGKIWLVLNQSGGQCLTDAGAKTRQWNWGSGNFTPTPLRPFFLSLNKTVGVRILGNKKVFVSFLAMGQTAKFSVGTCCTQGECKKSDSGSSELKEEQFVLAIKMRISLVIQQLHQFLTAPSRSRFPKTELASHHRVAALKSLEDEAEEEMSNTDSLHSKMS